MRRLAASVLLLGLVATGCQQSEDDRRADYCALVEEKADEVTRTVNEGGSAAFVELLPTLEKLADAAPSDLKDEWQTFVNALLALRDALDETGVDPDQVDGELPDGLSRDERRRVLSAVALLASADVVNDVKGIEQHALDVCHTPLL